MESLVEDFIMETIKVAWKRHMRCPTQLLLLVEIVHAIWIECNLISFCRSSFLLSIDHIIGHTLIQMDALMDDTLFPKKARIV